MFAPEICSAEIVTKTRASTNESSVGDEIRCFRTSDARIYSST